ncbi:MAG: NAD(P)-dependent alcohol dehydrogenase, partial [Actinomycetota bacterium]|nr:NAD(P)-dependent alcohol dehydrogenase [Actinomycetota bacterium]
MTSTTADQPTESIPPTAAAGVMAAVVQEQYGSAPEEVLRMAEVAKPTFDDDEVLLRVGAASVDRGTWH